jgi:hypothetical protein
MWFKKSVYFLLATLILASCGERKSPDSTGLASEIMVVCDKPQWDGVVGDSIRAALMQSVKGLREAEPEFTLIFIPRQDFSKFLVTNCNVLIIDIQAENKKCSVETLTNVWSHPQQVIKIKANSDTAFIAIFAKHRESIRALFEQNEKARFGVQNAKARNTVVEKLLEDEFGISMVVSKEFKLVKKTPDFVWLRSDTTLKSLGLLIYTYPFTDSAQMNPAAVLASRDQYAKRYITGPLKGSCMAVDGDAYPPFSLKILFKNMLAIETRGLWKTVGDFKSGPFVNYTVVDAPRQRIIAFDGYVYYPDKSKRDIMLQLEYIIRGAEFGESGR